VAVLQVDGGTLWNFFVKGAVFELERSSEGVLRFRFDRPNRCSVILLLIAIFSGSSLSLRAQKSVGSSKEFALVGARIYPAPDAKPIVNGIVVVANGKIVSVGEAATFRVPKGMRTIDCAGKTLVAGLWNTHVHFMEPKWDHAADLPAQQLTEQLQDMLTSYGFTSVVDTGSILENTVALRRRIMGGEVAGPRILTAGLIIFPKDGLPYYLTESLPPDMIAKLEKGEAATPADAVGIVDEQIAHGADIVKLYVVSWLRRDGRPVPYPMPLAVVKAATEEAHRKGKLVFAHPSTLEGVELVLAGHVDVLAHTSEEGSKWDAALSARLKAANVTLIPTLTLFSRDDAFDSILGEVKSYSDVHGRIMFGTDIGYLTDYSALTKEYGYMGRAGLTFPQILASLTTTPAARLGYAPRTGQIKKGMDADLTLLEGDPARDIDAFAHVALTIRMGQIIYEKR
jgi:imidazolonepropionase-like amidohydrolase